MAIKNWSTWAATAAALLGITTLLVVAFRPRAVLVDAAAVVDGPMRVTADEEARTRVREVYTVSAPISGRVRRSPLKVGDPVVAGTTILAIVEEMVPAFLDARVRGELEAQVAAAAAAVDLAAAELEQTKAELAFADSELQRAQQLARSNTIPSRTLERARLDAETRKAQATRAAAGLEVRRRDLETARARLLGPPVDPARALRDETACCVTVIAPVSGRVLKRIHESEQIHPAGTALIDIGDVADIEIVAEFLSTDAVKIREGAAAIVTGWGGPGTLAARVRRVEPAGFTKVSALGIEEQRVRVILDLATPHSERAALGHDFRVVVQVEVWAASSALRIPLSALFRRDEGWAAFVVMDGRAQLRRLGIGQRNSEHAQVLSGIKAGEAVILHPSDRIADGVRVAARPAAAVREPPADKTRASAGPN